MRFCKLMLGVLFAVPALAQGTASQAKPDVKATFSIMKANVAKITAPSEKERWEPNKDAWEVEVAQTGKLQKLDLGRISAALDKIKANIEKIRAGSEKERWQANIDLWQLFVAREGAFGRGDMEIGRASCSERV